MRLVAKGMWDRNVQLVVGHSAASPPLFSGTLVASELRAGGVIASVLPSRS